MNAKKVWRICLVCTCTCTYVFPSHVRVTLCLPVGLSRYRLTSVQVYLCTVYLCTVYLCTWVQSGQHTADGSRWERVISLKVRDGDVLKDGESTLTTDRHRWLGCYGDGILGGRVVWAEFSCGFLFRYVREEWSGVPVMCPVLAVFLNHCINKDYLSMSYQAHHKSQPAGIVRPPPIHTRTHARTHTHTHTHPKPSHTRTDYWLFSRAQRLWLVFNMIFTGGCPWSVPDYNSYPWWRG